MRAVLVSLSDPPAVYNAHVLAQICEIKTRTCIIPGQYSFRVCVRVFDSFSYAEELEV